MISDFEFSYYLHLTGNDFRNSMIQNGMDLLSNGYEGEYVATLAISDYEEDRELIDIFKKASKEIAVELPKEGDESEWIVEQKIKFIMEGRVLPEEDIDSSFKRNMAYLFKRLQSETIQKDYAGVSEFIEWYGKFVGETGHIDHYQIWLDELVARETLVLSGNAVGKIKEIISGITRLICGVSFGAIEEEHYENSMGLCRNVMAL